MSFCSSDGCGCGCGCGGDKSKEKKEVQETLGLWLTSVSSGSSDAVETLYMDDAVLLPEFSSVICDDPAKRHDYFKMFTACQNLKGKIDALHTRVLGDVAVNSGHYTFTFIKDGKEVTAPARFTYVYKKTALGWMIVEHHSSLISTGH